MHSTYPLILIGFILIFLYAITFSFSRLEIIKKITHRKIWNTLLLITFLVTAILGLILVIQVNYKLNIPNISTILKWHVYFGIGMTFVSIFHFIWHWNYYIKLFRKEKTKKEESDDNRIIKPDIKIGFFPVICLGFTCTVVQLVVLREIFAVFYGNELAIGIVFANWMIITGLGAYIGRLSVRFNISRAILGMLFMFIALIPLITLFLIYYLKNIVFIPGAAINIFQLFIFSAALLLPFCLITGFVFTMLVKIFLLKHKKNSAGKVYAYESFGGIFAGAIFTFIFSRFLTPTQILFIILTINLMVAAIIGTRNFIIRTLTPVLAVLSLVIVLLIPPDKYLKQLIYINQEILYTKDTPYGNLVVTSLADQLYFYENNIQLFSTDNKILIEESVHFPLLQHTNPEDILLISGGISGITNEILKYDISGIDYIELNPWLFEIGQQYTSSLNNEKINIIHADARSYIDTTQNKYDVVLINLPEPKTTHLNRYYSLEFFNKLKNILHQKGIVSFGLPSSANYADDMKLKQLSIICSTAKKVFDTITIIPGEKDFFLLSDYPLNINYQKLAKERKINNIYVNENYMDDFSLQFRSDQLSSSINFNEKTNKDYYPIAYFSTINTWLSKSKINPIIIYGIIILVFLIIFIFIIHAGNAPLVMFSAGLTGSAIEILLIFIFQIFFGYVYQSVGLFIAVFMTGLAIGAYIPFFNFKRVSMYLLLFIGIIAISVGLIYLLNNQQYQEIIIQTILYSLVFLTAFFVGKAYSATSLRGKSKLTSAGFIYAVDLTGAAIGALIIPVFILPLIGVYKAFGILVLLNLVVWIIALIRKK